MPLLVISILCSFSGLILAERGGSCNSFGKVRATQRQRPPLIVAAMTTDATMKRLAFALAAVGLAALAAPAAHAATISYDGAGAMVVTAAPGESNHVMIYPAGD